MTVDGTDSTVVDADEEWYEEADALRRGLPQQDIRALPLLDQVPEPRRRSPADAEPVERADEP